MKSMISNLNACVHQKKKEWEFCPRIMTYVLYCFIDPLFKVQHLGTNLYSESFRPLIFKIPIYSRLIGFFGMILTFWELVDRKFRKMKRNIVYSLMNFYSLAINEEYGE